MGRGEVDTFLNESSSHATPSRGGFYEEQPELSNVVSFSNEKNAADSLTVLLGNPAMLSRWIEVANEISCDLRNEILEPRVPAIFGRVYLAVPLDYPVDVFV